LRFRGNEQQAVKTRVLTADSTNIEGVVAEAVRLLREGRLVAFPTDTVYGVGAHAFQVRAVARLYQAKMRPRDKAIPLLLARAADLALVAAHIPPTASGLIARFWPGGLTLVLPKSQAVPAIVSASGPTVAVRVPNHPLTLALIAALEAPLAATSANLAADPSPLTAAEVVRGLGGRIDLIIDGGRCPGGVPSTVLDLTTDPPLILRRGAITETEIQAVPGIALKSPED
jgi:L-threonylcarbamoyladenylate synthase